MARRTPRRDATDPSKTPRSAASTLAARADGWENVFTGLGVQNRDKRTGSSPVVLDISFKQAEQLYRADDMAARIIDDPPREMVRKGVDILVQDDQDAAEAIEGRLDELEALERFRLALSWERAYGGSAIIILADDGVVDQSKPLNVATLQAIRGLTVVDPQELRPDTYYGDPARENYGAPEVYRLGGNRGGSKVVSSLLHESRIIRFTGIQASRMHAIQKQGWGDSVMVRVLEVLSDFSAGWGGAGALIQDFAQGVFKIRGLTELIASGREDVVRKRLEAIDMSRSIVHAAVLDAGDGEEGSTGEEFERKSTVLTGYPEMLDRFSLRLAAAADMPVSRLMGQAPAGLNATGAADVLWWTERIEGMQQEKLRRPFNRLVKLLLLSKEGPTKGVEPESWSVRFRPLRQLDPLQEAQRRLAIAQADKLYVDGGVVTPEEVSASRFGGDDFGEDLSCDAELRDAMEKPDPNEAEAAAALAGGAAPAPGDVKPVTAEAVDPSTALNGAQVASMQQIITAVAERKLPRETGVAMIAAAFPLSPDQADKVMGAVGLTFFAEAPEPKPSPFAGPPKPPEPPPVKTDGAERPSYRAIIQRDQNGRMVDVIYTPIDVVYAPPKE